MPSKSAPSLPLWKRRHSSTILHHSARYLLGCKGGWGCKVAPGRRAMHTALDSCSTPTRVAPRANKPLLPNWNAMPLLSSHVPVACPAYPAARAWHACPAPLVRQVHRLHALQCSPCRLPTSRAQEEREGVCTAPTSNFTSLRLKTSSVFSGSRPPPSSRPRPLPRAPWRAHPLSCPRRAALFSVTMLTLHPLQHSAATGPHRPSRHPGEHPTPTHTPTPNRLPSAGASSSR